MWCPQKVRLFAPARNRWSFSMQLTCVFGTRPGLNNQEILLCVFHCNYICTFLLRFLAHQSWCRFDRNTFPVSLFQRSSPSVNCHNSFLCATYFGKSCSPSTYIGTLSSGMPILCQDGRFVCTVAHASTYRRNWGLSECVFSFQSSRGKTSLYS